jgi:hypothetical protein
MSEFVRTLNLIKTHRGAEWLTLSQAQALTALKEALRVPGTVNLCGPTGVGKTFLAWTMVDELGYTYFPHLKHFIQLESVSVPGVVIDNADSSRQFHRNVLKALQFEDVKRAVLITRELIRDYTHYVELSLSSEDWEIVCHNLMSVGVLISDSRVPSLWHLVNPSLRRT